MKFVRCVADNDEVVLVALDAVEMIFNVAKRESPDMIAAKMAGISGGVRRAYYRVCGRDVKNSIFDAIVDVPLPNLDNDEISRTALLARINGPERPVIYDGNQYAEWIERCILEAPSVATRAPETEKGE